MIKSYPRFLTLTLREPRSLPAAPLSLAVRNGDPNRLMLLPRRRESLSRRFEAARFLAETLHAPATDHWLPATDSKTARQEVQRQLRR